MAPVPPDDSSSRHSETNTSNETSNPAASTTTPPSRSSNFNDDNPFIQFRRFADSQISSLLQSVIGLPSIFERPSPTARWIVIQSDGDGKEVYVNGDKVTMRQRHGLEEGWRKQREQEAEERARAADAFQGGEMKKWGCSVDGAASQVVGTKATSHEQDNSGSKRNGGLLDWLGWDGSQKHEDKHKDTIPRAGPITLPSVRMTVNEKDKSESLNPFSGNMSEAVSWLLTNEYSPVFLRGHIPADVDQGGPSFYHALHHPHWPDFRAASTPDRFEDEIRFRIPWCDAFEDLVSLQLNGHMIDRDEPTRTSSAQWLNDMIKRGSLGAITSGLGGPQWSTEYARAVLPFNSGRKPQYIPPPFSSSEDNLGDEDEGEFDPVVAAVDMLAEITDLGDGTDKFGSPKHWIGNTSDSLILAVLNDLKKPGALAELRRIGFTSEAEVLKYLLGDDADSLANGFVVDTADVVTAAMRAAAVSETKTNGAEQMTEESNEKTSSESLEENQKQVAALEQRYQPRFSTSGYTQTSSPLADHPPSSEEPDETPRFASSSSSTSSWSHWGAEDEKKDSVVSTMTTTERRTLHDGTVETKRVLKKRFADGREESNESVERQKSSSSDPRTALSKPSEIGSSSTTRQDKQTQTNTKEDPRPKRSGWFWRE